MKTMELAILYAVIGAGCAAAVLIVARGSAMRVGLSDAALLIPFWPLYGPFLLMRRPEPVPAATGALAADRQLARVIPDPASLEKLESRIAQATARVGEIDRLLREPAFDARAAEERERTLEARGDGRAAAAARARVASIKRLQQLRDRFARELTEVDELLAQLRVSAEVVRLAGTTTDDTRELVAELLGRAEGLDAILADDLPS